MAATVLFGFQPSQAKNSLNVGATEPKQRTPSVCSKSLLSELLTAAVKDAEMRTQQAGQHQWQEDSEEDYSEEEEYSDDEDVDYEMVEHPGAMSAPMEIPTARKDCSSALAHAMYQAQVAQLLAAQQAYAEQMARQAQAQTSSQVSRPGF